jgi:DNA mismatch endonuclease, patch repair protein
MTRPKTDPNRSAIMRAVKSTDTKPELAIRRFVHQLGYRFRLHRASLPGVPDLVFPRLKKVVFVHGCFWHGHDCARGARMPKSNREYWTAKIARNMERDQGNIALLADQGWGVYIAWECQIKTVQAQEELRLFLEQPLATGSEYRFGGQVKRIGN